MRIFLALLSLILFSCSEKDSDKIGDAQTCINTATAATVDECLLKISGLTSPESYRIRCAAHYIRQGFNEGTVFEDLVTKLTESTDQNPMLAAAPLLAFKDHGGVDKTTLINNAKTDCNQANSSGMAFIVGVSDTATVLAGLSSISTIISSGGEPTAEDYQNAVSQLQGESAATVGQTVINMNDQYCSSGTKDEQVCGDLAAAIDGDSDPEVVGNKMKCIMEFEEQLEFPTLTDPTASACQQCNHAHCRFTVGKETTQPTCTQDPNCGTAQEGT